MRMGHWWSDEDMATPNFAIIITGKIKVLAGKKNLSHSNFFHH
jgi:hypothetical protein